MKKRIVLIGVGVVVLALALGAGGLYAYDSSRSDVIARGITAGGVDIGGLSASRARDVLERSLGPRIGAAVIVKWHDRGGILHASDIDAHVNVARMVNEALDHSRNGNFLSRAVRDLRGKKVKATISTRVAYSPPRLRTFVDSIEKQIERKPVSAEIHPTGASLNFTPSRDGVAVQRRWLTGRILRELRDPSSDHRVLVPTRTLQPKVTTARLKYLNSTYITIDRAHFTLRLWKNLRLVKSYTIAVGQQGLETPAGQYEINDRQVNPSWHVPNSPWAGELAGRVIPPGPDDPIKARWLGFYNGAGIHGTDAISSLGTAASHGCIRMSIPDVEELYDQVPLHTPIYVG